MFSMKATILLIVIACLSACLLILLSSKPERSIGETARTIGLIKQCELLESGKLEFGLKHQDVSNYLHSNEADGLSLRQIFAAMCACPTCIPERIVGITNVQDITNTATVTDSWGKSLNFVWRDDAIRSNICDALLLKSLPVLIWSSGPNGSNEFGKGDDIFVGKETTK